MRHCGKPVDARPARETHQKGFGLIVSGMGEGDMRYAVGLGPERHQVIAGFAGPFLKIALSVPAAPVFDMV